MMGRVNMKDLEQFWQEHGDSPLDTSRVVEYERIEKPEGPCTPDPMRPSIKRYSPATVAYKVKLDDGTYWGAWTYASKYA